jgi:hypothetical protein
VAPHLKYLTDYYNWFVRLQFGKYEYQSYVVAFSVALILVYLATALRRFLWRRKNFSDMKIVRKISRWPSWLSEFLRFAVFVSVASLIAILLLEPINKIYEKFPVYEPSFIAVGLDGSMSMLAKTVPGERKSRLDLAKEQINALALALIREGGGDNLALFTFTKEPFMETKDFSNDYAAMFLPQLFFVDDFYARAFGFGTDLAKALEFCGKIFPKTDRQKICLLFTDGELEGPDLKKLDEKFQEALDKWHSEKRDIRLYFIATGSSEKAERIYQVNVSGEETDKPELDDKGKPIETRVRPEYLRKAAIKSGGGFAHLKYTDEANPVVPELVQKGKKIIDYRTSEKIDDVSDTFIRAYLIALLILVLII